MSDSFDAYYKWLGIPPEEQPPNYYRLLGVRAFEADLDVIANAADQRMTHVRTYQSGKHGAQSQALLNEISAAKLCVLHPARKADYDARLHAELAARQPAAAPPPPRIGAPVGAWPQGAMPGVAMQGGMAMPLPPPAAPGRAVAYPVANSAPRVTPAPQPAPAQPTPAQPEALSELGQIQAVSLRRRPRQQKKSLLGPALLCLALGGAAAGGGWWLLNQPAPSAMNGADPKPKHVEHGGAQPTGHEAHEPTEHATQHEPAEDKHDKGPKTAGRAKESGEAESAEAPHEALDSLLAHLKAAVTRESVQQTDAVGGEAGEPFDEIHKGALLVGLDLCFETEGKKRPMLCGLIGVFIGDKGLIRSRLHGAAGNPRKKTSVLARSGYAVSVMDVLAEGDRVTAMRLEFRPIGATRLLKRNPYNSPWFGDPGAGEPVQLGDESRPVIGLFGFASSTAISGLGLILPPKSSTSSTPAPGKAKPGKTPAVAADRPPTKPAKPDSEVPILSADMPSRTFSAAKLTADQPKAPVPDAAEQARAVLKIHDLFKTQYAEIRSPGVGKIQQIQEKRVALAEKLCREAEQTGDDAVARYVLFDEALKLAVQAGDSHAVLEVILAMAGRYTIDDVQTTMESLTDAEKVNTAPILKLRLAENCLRLIDKAVEREQFDVADQLDLLVVRKAAKAAGDTLLAHRIGWRQATLVEQRRAHDEVQPAIETLKTKPDDAAACTAVGRYRCLVQGDWAAGLPLLAKGNDPALASLATREMAIPSEPADRVKLAEEWLAAAQPDDPLAAQYKSQARQWFKIALPELSGVTRMTVAKKIEDILGGHGLSVEYFEGVASFDNPVRRGADPQIDMNYEVTTPEGLSSNRFTARWTGWIAPPPKNGPVAILVEHEGGARLWIDGKPMVDSWADSGKQQVIAQFPGGKAKRVKLEYFSRGLGHPRISLRWAQRDGFPEQPIGPEALFQDRTNLEKTYSPLAVPLGGRSPLLDASP